MTTTLDREAALTVLMTEGSGYWACVAAATRIYQLDCEAAGRPFDPVGVLARAGRMEQAAEVAHLHDFGGGPTDTFLGSTS